MDKRGALKVKIPEATVQQTMVDGNLPVTMRLRLESGTHPTTMAATRAAGTRATRTIWRLVATLLLVTIPPRPTIGFEGSHMQNLPSRPWLELLRRIFDPPSRPSIAYLSIGSFPFLDHMDAVVQH
jgi:hypothetical protein